MEHQFDVMNRKLDGMESITEYREALESLKTRLVMEISSKMDDEAALDPLHRFTIYSNPPSIGL